MTSSETCVDAKRRLIALKKLQVQQFRADKQLEEEFQVLKAKNAALIQPMLEKRAAIINGTYDPTNEDYQMDNPGIIGRYEAETDKVLPLPFVGVKGIPFFWLTVLKNDDYFDGVILPQDEPALKRLTDIKAKINRSDFNIDITFHFEANDFFTNDKLTKHYEVSCEVPTGAPFDFVGRDVVRSESTTIDWKLNRDLTKIPPNKQGNTSFFTIFNPMTVDGNGMFQDYAHDYEFGKHVMRHTIPDAVLYFTGETLEEDFDGDDAEEII